MTDHDVSRDLGQVREVKVDVTVCSRVVPRRMNTEKMMQRVRMTTNPVCSCCALEFVDISVNCREIMILAVYDQGRQFESSRKRSVPVHRLTTVVVVVVVVAQDDKLNGFKTTSNSSQ